MENSNSSSNSNGKKVPNNYLLLPIGLFALAAFIIWYASNMNQ